MARPLRIEFPGAVYHVTNRGNRKARIYAEDADRKAFLDILAAAIERFHWRCHAYCLMTNHYHLLVETPRPNLARGMRHLNGVYTQHYNRTHHKPGHLFQGRYHAVVIDTESHFLEVARYTVLNPVRARIAPTPERYPWSSYRATAGYRNPPPWLDTASTLRRFGSRRDKAHPAYRQFVREGIGEPSPLDDVVAGCILGTAAFIQKCRQHLDPDADLAELRYHAEIEDRPGLDALFAKVKPANKTARNKAIFTAYRKHGYTQKEIADHLGLHYATISRLIRESELA